MASGLHHFTICTFVQESWQRHCGTPGFASKAQIDSLQISEVKLYFLNYQTLDN
jgi:hypothetical protein